VSGRRVVLLAALGSSLAAPAGAAAAPDARLTGAFAMSGRVTVADHVRGEHRGDRVRRRWRFVPTCRQGACNDVVLRRGRGRGKVDTLTLARTGPGVYAGRGRFFVPLRCAGRRYPRGGRVPFRVTVRITAFETVFGVPIATVVRARYVNRRRFNRTKCPGGIGHDAARYRGTIIQGSG
jgi:hypothetical protein